MWESIKELNAKDKNPYYLEKPQFTPNRDKVIDPRKDLGHEVPKLQYG